VSDYSNGVVTRIRAGDGKILQTWAVEGADWLLVAMGRVFVTGTAGIYLIDPRSSEPAELVV
jgi:hypothetical protein